ncbi:MAG: flagellar hook capping protein [Betaproteobacteria bacterium]|nr:flagellar hook capping protein [Betaproteobacteria bacterium]
MAIEAVSSSTLQANGLGIQDFLKILLTQLTYQDPMKPLDNKEFMAQIAQFTTLEQTQQLNSKIETLVANQAALQSVGLIGRTVDIFNNGTQVSGVVRALSLTGESPRLSIQTSSGATLDNIALSQVLNVR